MSESLDRDYLVALAHHLEEQTEGSLSRAYELGRQALAAELGVLDTLSLYEGAFRNLVLTAPVADQPRIASELLNFFREMLSPFEMAFRGYREANSELLRVNQELLRANAELQTKQLQLVQSAKMASLGELVAGIAHEINNPLAFVLSHLTTVSKTLARVENELGDSLSLSAKEALERAQNRLQESEAGAERIRNLVLKLRTFSRLDEGEKKTVSMRESVQSVLTILEHRFHDRIELKTSFGEPDVIECYSSLLNQAVMNLVANAVDAISEHGVITITTGAQGNDYVISVADTGHGIPPDLRERVLEPFFTTKPIGQGTGLGLSITHSIAQRHAGSLELEPGPAGGTIASIRFPLKQAEA
jgi:two-component system NtrC family sensor kinase